jgi:hypothetical protein
VGGQSDVLQQGQIYLEVVLVLGLAQRTILLLVTVFGNQLHKKMLREWSSRGEDVKSVQWCQ